MGKCIGTFRAKCSDGKVHEGELLVCEAMTCYIGEKGLLRTNYWYCEPEDIEEIGNAGQWDEIKDWVIRRAQDIRETNRRINERRKFGKTD